MGWATEYLRTKTAAHPLTTALGTVGGTLAGAYLGEHAGQALGHAFGGPSMSSHAANAHALEHQYGIPTTNPGIPELDRLAVNDPAGFEAQAEIARQAAGSEMGMIGRLGGATIGGLGVNAALSAPPRYRSV